MKKQKNNISVLPPNPINKKANPNIFKMSYIKSDGQYKQFSDIDFKHIPQDSEVYFRNLQYMTAKVLDTNILFVFQNIEALINEKLYYKYKYARFKYELEKGHKITEKGYEYITIADCKFIIDKFDRSLLALSTSLIKSQNPWYF